MKRAAFQPIDTCNNTCDDTCNNTCDDTCNNTCDDTCNAIFTCFILFVDSSISSDCRVPILVYDCEIILLSGFDAK